MENKGKSTPVLVIPKGHSRLGLAKNKDGYVLVFGFAEKYAEPGSRPPKDETPHIIAGVQLWGLEQARIMGKYLIELADETEDAEKDGNGDG